MKYQLKMNVDKKILILYLTYLLISKYILLLCEVKIILIIETIVQYIYCINIEICKIILTDDS